MFLTTRRPTGELTNLRRLNHILDEAFHGWPFSEESNGTITSSWLPPCDVFEDAETIKIVAELPGIPAQDVKISLENNVLTLRGEKKQVAEESSDRVHRYERSYGVFERTFSLPSTVDADRIDASFADGVLTVVLPKVERARPREIPVRSTAG